MVNNDNMNLLGQLYSIKKSPNKYISMLKTEKSILRLIFINLSIKY